MRRLIVRLTSGESSLFTGREKIPRARSIKKPTVRENNIDCRSFIVNHFCANSRDCLVFAIVIGRKWARNAKGSIGKTGTLDLERLRLEGIKEKWNRRDWQWSRKRRSKELLWSDQLCVSLENVFPFILAARFLNFFQEERDDKIIPMTFWMGQWQRWTNN